MRDGGLTRRAFLRRAGGSAGVVAVGLGSASALAAGPAPTPHAALAAQLDAPGQAAVPEAQAAPASPMAQRRPQYYAFFNETQAETVEAIAERLWPGAPDKPGARDANVRNYIDLALAGAYADRQDFYRRGLEALEAHSQNGYGQPFRRLAGDQQDDVLRAVQSGQAAEFTWPGAAAFFNLLWTHTIEGMFADPVYGGNRDFAGWRLVEFPGAQAFFLHSDMQTDAKFTRAPIVGLQHQYDERLSRAGGE